MQTVPARFVTAGVNDPRSLSTTTEGLFSHDPWQDPGQDPWARAAAMRAERQGGLEEKVQTPVDKSTGVRDDPWAQWGRPGDSQGGVGRFPPSPTGDKGSFKGKYQDPFENYGKGRGYTDDQSEGGFRSAEESPTPVDTRTEFEKMLDTQYQTCVRTGIHGIQFIKDQMRILMRL